MDKVKILQDIKKDYEACKMPKTKVDNAITGWTRQYNGDKYGNEVKGRSQIVSKDTKRAIKKMAPSIIQPFIASDTIIKAKPKTLKSQATSSLASDVLNYQYNNEFDKLRFIRTIASVFPKEGTVWIRTGWEFDEEIEKKTLNGLDVYALQALQGQSNDIENVKQDKDGTYGLTLVKRNLLYNRPTAVIRRNEMIYPDPTAEHPDDCRFVIDQFEKSLSDLAKMEGVYDLSNMTEIERFINDSTSYADGSLGAKRYADGIETGMDLAFKSSSKANKKLTILEYWGEYDMNGDGKAEQIVFAWIKGTDIVIRCEENPYPDKKIPFVGEVFDIEPFAVWGRALADAIEDNQKIRTAIMRGFIDNLSLSNNGQKFFRKGALDYINMQKLLNGEKVVEVNDIEGFKDGSYNQIPQSSFNVFDVQEAEIEALTGVSRHLDGVDDATIGRTAAGVQSTMTAAQRHMVIIVSVIGNLYKKIFERWHAYNQVFLDEGQMFEIAGDLVEFAKQDIQGNHNIEININVDALNQQKIQQINMLLQQTQNMGGSVPPMVVPHLVAEIFSSFGKEELAEQIRQYQPQPDPMQQQMMMLEMKEKEANIQLLMAQAQQEMARVQAIIAQAKAHGSKADNVDMDTLLKAKEMREGQDEIDTGMADVESKYNDMALKSQQAQQQMAHKEAQFNFDSALKADAHEHNKKLSEMKAKQAPIASKSKK